MKVLAMFFRKKYQKAEMHQLDEVHLSYLPVALGIDLKWKSTSLQEPSLVPMKSL